jgi:molybdate transport system substrate-binding protein
VTSRSQREIDADAGFAAEEAEVKSRLNLRAWQCLLLFGPVMTGCHRADDTPKASEPVTAFVAASTKDAVQEIAAAFRSEKNTEVKLNADDSSKLATQIVQEAPAHLFLSANEKWADFVKEKGFAQETTLLLGNSLVIVTPKGNPAAIHNAYDLTKPSLKRLAVAGPTVPAGMYARQALRNLKVWNGLEAQKKIISGDNVRATLTYVERGEVEAGIVYATDAKVSDDVSLVYTFPADTHEPIRYPLVLLKAGNASSSARSFFDYLQSPKATEVFAKHGFSLLDKK